MNYQREIERTHKLIWAAREALEEVWPTPPPRDCLLFAIAECGELIEALVYYENDKYSPNRKQEDFLDELADVVIMILSVKREEAIPVHKYYDGYDRQSSIWEAFLMLEEVMGAYSYYPNVNHLSLAIVRAVCWPSFDMYERVRDRLARIAYKRGKLNEFLGVIRKLA